MHTAPMHPDNDILHKNKEVCQNCPKSTHKQFAHKVTLRPKLIGNRRFWFLTAPERTDTLARSLYLLPSCCRPLPSFGPQLLRIKD